MKRVAVSQELPKLPPTYHTCHVRSLSGALHMPRQHMATCVAETRLSNVIIRGGSFAVLVYAVCARTHALTG
jgi:hypothetical protein